MHPTPETRGHVWPSLLRWSGRTLPPLMRTLGRFGTMRPAMVAAVAMVIAYLAYDLAKGRMSPCDAIFQETSVGLSANIHFLKTEAALQLGKEAVTELDDRGKMTALNLKTCCTVLDAGRIDPEQFLQCKIKARAYDTSVEDVVALVKTALKDVTTGATTSALPAALSAPAAPKPEPRLAPAMEAKVAAARDVSRTFNQQVVEVLKQESIRSLEATPPQSVAIDAQEREPNDGPLATNVIELGKWVTGAVGAPKDADFYTFMTPETYRDWIRIELQNRSTTLDPRLDLFDADKSSLGEVHKTTAGSDVTYAFVAPPKSRYAVRVSNYYGESVGVYLLRVAAAKSSDPSEPNDDILSARPIPVGTPLAAGIMDRYDVDFFSFPVPDGDNALVVTLANRSVSLHPMIAVFDGTKAQLGEMHNSTAGGEVSYSFKAKGPTTYFVRVSDYYSNSPGDYTLTVGRQ